MHELPRLNRGGGDGAAQIERAVPGAREHGENADDDHERRSEQQAASAPRDAQLQELPPRPFNGAFRAREVRPAAARNDSRIGEPGNPKAWRSAFER